MTDAAIDYEARNQISTHEKVCAERYVNLWDAIKDLKSTVQSDSAVAHARFTAISNRMWAAVAGVCAAAVLALLGGTAFMIAHLLQRVPV